MLVLFAIVHPFNDENWKVLESEGRRRMQPVKPVIEKISSILKRKNTAFDIGAGTGYYTIPLSKIFKRVFAVEMNEKMVDILTKRLEENNIKNVGIILSKDPPLVDFDVDFVLFANVLHEMDVNLRVKYLRWAKSADCICVIDWKKDSNLGPPKHVKIDELEVINLLNNLGFDTNDFDIYSHHYVIFALK